MCEREGSVEDNTSVKTGGKHEDNHTNGQLDHGWSDKDDNAGDVDNYDEDLEGGDTSEESGINTHYRVVRYCYAVLDLFFDMDPGYFTLL